MTQEERAREVLAASGKVAEWIGFSAGSIKDRRSWDDTAEKLWREARAALAVLSDAPLTLAAEVREEGSAIVSALGDILAHFDDREQAPGHSHLIPGVWDRDIGNGNKGGTACEWCAKWSNAQQIYAAAIRAQGGERG